MYHIDTFIRIYWKCDKDETAAIELLPLRHRKQTKKKHTHTQEQENRIANAIKWWETEKSENENWWWIKKKLNQICDEIKKKRARLFRMCWTTRMSINHSGVVPPKLLLRALRKLIDKRISQPTARMIDSLTERNRNT